MKITVIVDNRPNERNPQLLTEHGLSLYIEYNNYRILCDVGSSSQFAYNAKTLDIDISTCDITFISHGHNDHCGGLRHLVDTIKGERIYMHTSIPYEEFFSTRRGTRRDLSIDRNLFCSHKERFTFLDGTTKIAEGVFAVQCTTTTSPVPYGNCFLWKCNGQKEENDTFTHEMSLAFITSKGLVVVSPCSHCGALNIIHDCKKATGCNKVYAYIGGLHFVEGENCVNETTAFADAIKHEYPDTLFFTGHCTCDTAKNLLVEKNHNTTIFSTGTIIEL